MVDGTGYGVTFSDDENHDIAKAANLDHSHLTLQFNSVYLLGKASSRLQKFQR